MNGLGLVALRLVLAVVFVAHGAHKLFGLWAGPGIGVGGPDITAQVLAGLDLNPAFPLAVFLGIAELVGGLLLVVGFLTRFVSPILAVIISVAIWKVNLANGFFLNWNGIPDRGQGMEYGVVLIGALVCLTLTGAGEWSIDGHRESTRASREAGRARLRGKF